MPEQKTDTSTNPMTPLLIIGMGLLFFVTIAIILLISSYIFSQRTVRQEETDTRLTGSQAVTDAVTDTDTDTDTDAVTDSDVTDLTNSLEEVDNALEEVNSAISDLDSSLEETDTPPEF